MKFKDLPDWPPPWQPLLLRSAKPTSGEIGVLKSVRPLHASDDYLILTIEHEGIDYRGLIHVDPVWKAKVISILETHEGHSVEEIGQLDIFIER